MSWAGTKHPTHENWTWNLRGEGWRFNIVVAVLAISVGGCASRRVGAGEGAIYPVTMADVPDAVIQMRRSGCFGRSVSRLQRLDLSGRSGCLRGACSRCRHRRTARLRFFRGAQCTHLSDRRRKVSRQRQRLLRLFRVQAGRDGGARLPPGEHRQDDRPRCAVSVGATGYPRARTGDRSGGWRRALDDGTIHRRCERSVARAVTARG